MRIVAVLAVLALQLAVPVAASADHCGAAAEIRPVVGPPTTVFVFSAYLGSPADLLVYRDDVLVDTIALEGDDELRGLIRTEADGAGSWRAEAVVRGSTACTAETAFEVVPGTTADVWVGLTGTMDWQPAFDYAIEMDGRAWVFQRVSGGGLITHPVSKPTVVRLRRLPDCTPLVRFVAAPGGRYEIRLDAAERPLPVEDWTLLGMDTPGGPDATDPTCPPLPDTSNGGASAPQGLIALLGGVGAFAVVMLARRRATAASGVQP